MHDGLASHRNRFNIEEGAKCRFCDSNEENMIQYLYNCPNFYGLRRANPNFPPERDKLFQDEYITETIEILNNIELFNTT